MDQLIPAAEKGTRGPRRRPFGGHAGLRWFSARSLLAVESEAEDNDELEEEDFKFVRFADLVHPKDQEAGVQTNEYAHVMDGRGLDARDELETPTEPDVVGEHAEPQNRVEVQQGEQLIVDQMVSDDERVIVIRPPGLRLSVGTVATTRRSNRVPKIPSRLRDM